MDAHFCADFIFGVSPLLQNLFRDIETLQSYFESDYRSHKAMEILAGNYDSMYILNEMVT